MSHVVKNDENEGIYYIMEYKFVKLVCKMNDRLYLNYPILVFLIALYADEKKIKIGIFTKEKWRKMKHSVIYLLY